MRLLILAIILLPSFFKAQNLVPNPGFTNLTSGFPTGFESDYEVGQGIGSISVQNDSIPVGWVLRANAISPCSGPDPDKLLLINGQSETTNTSLDALRSSSIVIEPNKCYRFGIWVKGIQASTQLVIKKPGGSYDGRKSTSVSPSSNTWSFISGTFLSDLNQSSVILAVRNTNAQASGNDFVLDEISLTRVNTYNVYSTCGCPNSFTTGSYRGNEIDDRSVSQEETVAGTGMWSVHVYPNPAHDVIHYELGAGAEGAYAVTLYDRMGRQLHRSVAKFERGSESGFIQRDHTWAPGLYFVVFNHEKSGETIVKNIVLD